MQLTCLTLRLWPFRLGKRSDIEIKQISINIKLSDLIGFGYDLSDTQDGLECWRMGFIFYGKHPLLLTRIQVSDPGPM